MDRIEGAPLVLAAEFRHESLSVYCLPRLKLLYISNAGTLEPGYCRERAISGENFSLLRMSSS
jgi:hypothetical protein